MNGYDNLKNTGDSVGEILSLGKDESSEIMNTISVVKPVLREIRKENINSLYDMIGEFIPYISISLNNDMIEIKIKKTSIKKMSKFEHNNQFYYPIFEDIFQRFSTNYIDTIRSTIKEKYNKDLTLNSILECTSCTYSINPIFDNIINVYI